MRTQTGKDSMVTGRKSGQRLSHRLGILLIVLLILTGVELITLAIKWPFTRRESVVSLEQVSETDVQIGKFHMLFVPHPGYIAQDVTFRRDSALSNRPLVRLAKITCRGSWLNLLSFRHRIPRIELEGAQFYIPAHVPPGIRKHPQAKITTTVTDLYANGTVLEIAPRQEGSRTVRFDFPELGLSNLAKNTPIHFRTRVINKGLIGRLSAAGTVGPLVLKKVAETRIDGNYRLNDDDLSTYKLIAGILSADGRFQGTLGSAEVTGRAAIRNFEITSNRHAVELTGEYNTVVDGIKGNVTIQSATVRMLRSILLARGSVRGEKGKILSLDIDGGQARIEDLLHLFVKADRPALNGALKLQAHVVLPPKQEPFLKRVQLEGNFRIDGAEFTSPRTEEKLDELSARALGNGKPKGENVSKIVTAELKSDVKLEGGLATLSEAVFAVPGALTSGGGTFNVLDEKIDLRGKLAMRASLSRAAGGMKSVLLMPLDPFFKKDGAGAVLPIRILGTYSHPAFRLSLTKSRYGN